MISNAVANTPASSGPARSGHSGRASGEADSTFRDVLDKSTKAEAGAPGKETETTESKPRSAFADTGWRSALAKVPEEQPVDGDAEAAVSGEDLLKDGEAKVQDAAGKRLAESGKGQDEGAQMQVEAEGGAVDDASGQKVAQAAGAAANAATANAAESLARANDTAGEKAPLPGKVVTKDGKTVADTDGAGDVKEELAVKTSGKAFADAPTDKSDQRGTRNTPANAFGSGPAASTESAERNSPAGRTSIPMATVDTAGDSRAATSVRVTTDMPGQPRRVSGDFANNIARPSAEPAGVAFKATGSADILPGTMDMSASRQVADAVARELEELTPSRLSLTGSTAPGGRTVTTMRLQLNPAELGTVNIRMQSVDGELRVTIQADSEQTSRMLQNDSDAIRSALRAAGISSADVVVTGNRNDSAQAQNFNAQQRDPSGQQMGAQENGRNASNESRQSNRESSSNDSAQTQARGSDAGDSGTGRNSRIVI